MEDILNTAHIHLDHAVFRIHVETSDDYPVDVMNEADDKPGFVLWIGRSNDPAQNKQSLIVNVVDGYDLIELAEWVYSHKMPG